MGDIRVVMEIIELVVYKVHGYPCHENKFLEKTVTTSISKKKYQYK